MLIDHIAELFVADYPAAYFFMRLIGRLTGATMCFFVAEGFYYTHSKYKYGMRLGIFALVSQLAYTFFHYKTLFTVNLFTDWNVIATFFVGFLVLLVYEKVKNMPVKWITIVLLCALTLFSDWYLVGPVWILCFYIFRDNKKKSFIMFSIFAAMEVATSISLAISHNKWWHIGVFFAIPLLWSYKGDKGSNSLVHKWIFYIFYPLHLFVLGMIYYILT
jgi:uncharacterized membrane protein YobD (UPF0266 family)